MSNNKYIEPISCLEFFELPKNWTNPRTGKTINGLTESNCERFGWEIRPISELPAPTKYSKLKIVNELNKRAIVDGQVMTRREFEEAYPETDFPTETVWNLVYNFIVESGFSVVWENCVNLSNDNSYFNDFVNLLEAQLPSLDVNAILDKCIYEND